MSLYPGTPPFFGFRYDNWGTNPSATIGTSVTPGATNAEGAWTSVATGANLSTDICGFQVWVGGGNSTGNQKDHLLDIGVDPAGGTSYTPIISDIVCGQSGALTQGGNPFFFPFSIKAGSQVAVRVQGSSGTAGTVRVPMRFYGRPNDMLRLPCGSFSETIGTITSSGGVSFTPGNAADGAWVSLGTTSKPLWWWQLGVQCSNGTITAQYTYAELAWGDSTNKHTILKTVMNFPGTAEICNLSPNELSPYEAYCPVPAGATIYVRGRCNTSPVAGYNAVAIGVGG